MIGLSPAADCESRRRATDLVADYLLRSCGRKIVLAQVDTIKTRRQAEISAVIHDEFDRVAIVRFNSRACSSISRALPFLFRYCSRVAPPAIGFTGETAAESEYPESGASRMA